MPLTTNVSTDGRVLTIMVSGRFDFSLHREFRGSYEATEDPQHVIVDLENAEYMDSSALGMLLVLKEFVEDRSADITLIRPSDSVKEILGVANFDKLFRIV